MAIGDTRELLAMSARDDAVQVWCTWEETGTGMVKGQIRPTYRLVSFRVVNDTADVVTVLIAAASMPQPQPMWWYQVPPGGGTFALTEEQLAATADGVSVSLSAG